MYDPIDVAKKVEEIVVRGALKKYYRFRPTGFYGGIVTADTVGCNLRCRIRPSRKKQRLFRNLNELNFG